MGREIRRVPPNWEHPRYTPENPPIRSARNPTHWMGRYIPMVDQSFDDVAREWLMELMEWQTGSHLDYKEGVFFWEYAGDPPSREDCRPAFAEEPTWYQVYETVSEGTPVTPPFETEEELVDYLATYGEMFGTEYCRILSREEAEKFVSRGSAPSLMVVDGQVLDSYQSVQALDTAERGN